MKKICSTCNHEKDIEEFALRNKETERRQAQCRACQKVYRRKHYETNKSSYLEKRKKFQEKCFEIYKNLKNKPCIDCEESYPHYVMDFDHVRGQKKYDVSYLAHNGMLGKLLTEVRKCDLVCANCHRERTHQREETNQWRLPKIY